MDQQNLKGVKSQCENNDGHVRPDHVEEYGKLEDTNLELMGDPGRFQPRLLAIRGKYDNNDWHK